MHIEKFSLLFVVYKMVVSMTRRILTIFAIFACIILLTQVTQAYAKDSEVRKKMASREKQLVEEQEKKEKEKKKKDFEAQKKALDAVEKVVKQKEPKGKSAVDASNAAKIKKIKDAEAAYDAAKTALKTAEKTYNANKADETKAKAYEDAKKAFEKAKIDRELAKLGQ